jgi:hypothetical protein
MPEHSAENAAFESCARGFRRHVRLTPHPAPRPALLPLPHCSDYLATARARREYNNLSTGAVPGLGVQLNLSGNTIVVGLHLDVGKILPASLGFGAAAAHPPLGAPSTP